jgi:hypothetical protein
VAEVEAEVPGSLDPCYHLHVEAAVVEVGEVVSVAEVVDASDARK